jgi:hypothetical protein
MRGCPLPVGPALMVSVLQCPALVGLLCCVLLQCAALMGLLCCAQCAPQEVPSEGPIGEASPPAAAHLTELDVELSHPRGDSFIDLHARRARWYSGEQPSAMALRDVNLALRQGLVTVHARAGQAWWGSAGGVTMHRAELWAPSWADMSLTADRLEVPPAGGWRGEGIRARFTIKGQVLP